MNDTFTVNNRKESQPGSPPRAISGGAAALGPAQSFRQAGWPMTYWALAARTGSFWGHLFSSFWFGSLPSPTEESLPVKSGRSCRCNQVRVPRA